MAVTLVAGLLVGGWSAWWVSGQARWIGGVSVDQWRTNTMIGASDAGPYVRATTARLGLMALNRKEAVYYLRWRDNEGSRFRESCRYTVSVPPLPARWWSITLYDAQQYLARNDDSAHSVGSWDWPRVEDRPIQFEMGPRSRPDQFWLSTRNAGHFSLVLRLYHPESNLIEHPGDLPAPTIERLGCPGGSGA